MASAGFGPYPLAECEISEQLAQLQGMHNCFNDNPQLGPSWYWSHAGQCAPQDCAARELERAGVSEGLNFGALLLPYALDWGDKIGIATWHKAYASALHAFPSPRDRVYAFAQFQKFVSPKDHYINRVGGFLMGLTAFAGWRWQGEALKQWLDKADGAAAGFGEPASLAAGPALDAALGWIAAVRPLWEQLTIEQFPYTATDMQPYWREHEPVAALS